MLAVLKNLSYRRLFFAQVIALLGTGLSTVALALLAYDLAGGNAGAVLGAALALKMVAYVSIAPIVGGLAHRLPRRVLLVSLDLLRAALVCLLPFVTEVWQVFLLIFLLNACSAGFTPTFQATIADVLPEEVDYTQALSLSRLAYDLENLFSPALAAAALLFLSYDGLFSLNACAFLVSAALIVTLQLPRPVAPERTGGLWANTRFGLESYLRTPRLQGLLILSLAVAAAGAMVIVNTVVYVREHLGRSETDTALVLAAYGFGSMVVALSLPRLLKGRSDRPLMLTGAFLLAAGLAAGLFKPGFFALLPLWALLGAGASLVQTPAGRLLVRSSQEADRPAYYAAQFALSHGCWLLAYPLAGYLSSGPGLDAAFLVLALVALASALAAAWVWPRDDAVPLKHRHEALRHEHLHVHDEHHQHDHKGFEGEEPHRHEHLHEVLEHSHPVTIDLHHPTWPISSGRGNSQSHEHGHG
ncbi:MAG: MFS transporter [Pseudomonadota bacterium]